MLKNSYTTVIIFISMLGIIFNSSVIISSLRDTLMLCFSIIIPSLFPFMVLSSMFVGNTKQNSKGVISKLSGSLFGISPYGTAAFICGILCGYPVGAKCVSNLYRENKISLSEAQSLIAYCNNSGPLFVIGAVGVGMFSSLKTGALLYLIHIFSAFCCAIVLKPFTYSKAYTVKSETNKKDITSCIIESSISVINVCGFVLFFAAVNELIAPVISFMPPYVKAIAASFIEVTNGTKKVFDCTVSKDIKLALVSLALGWSGLSVHLQVKSFVSPLKISMKKYYLSRAFISLFSSLITFLLVKHIDDMALIVLSNTAFVFFIVFIILAAIYFYIAKAKKLQMEKTR